MKKSIAAFIYTALIAGANPASANDADKILLLRDDDMRKLVIHGGPQATSTAKFSKEDNGGDTTLKDYHGKYILLNFWATWCAPCRQEMPHLAKLQKEFGGDNFEVLTIATGRNAPEGIKRFFVENGITGLPRHQDPRKALASQMAVAALPVTIILDPDGKEIARLTGDADWYSDSARKIIKALVGKKDD